MKKIGKLMMIFKNNDKFIPTNVSSIAFKIPFLDFINRSKTIKYIFIALIIILIGVTVVSIEFYTHFSKSKAENIGLTWLLGFISYLAIISIIFTVWKLIIFLKNTFKLKKYWKQIQPILKEKNIQIDSYDFNKIYQVFLEDDEFKLKRNLVNLMLNEKK